jgi:RNA polymerase sigma-70 factor (ECF subfamily)
MSMTDQELLAHIADGGREAFAQFYDRYAARMLGLIRSITNDQSRAEDVLQEVFWHVWQKASTFDASRSSPLAWLMMLTRGRAIDQMRRATVAGQMQQRLVISVNGHANSNRDERANVDVRDDAAHARRAVASLPAEQLDAVSLAFHGGMTCAQIAQLRGLPLGTVKTRIRLAMARLRNTLATHVEVSRS